MNHSTLCGANEHTFTDLYIIPYFIDFVKILIKFICCIMASSASFDILTT